MKVKDVEDKEELLPGTIYFAPPDYHVLVEDNYMLSLSGDEPVLFSRPSIDVLFESAADAYGGNAIGILLTGANSDGAHGIAAIGKAGGVVLVEKPENAYCAVMPKAAIAAFSAVHVLSLEEIALYLRKTVCI
jgi:two-component system, chemotaxis family, protein-glutamate methylesterase/glutaminase